MFQSPSSATPVLNQYEVGLEVQRHRHSVPEVGIAVLRRATVAMLCTIALLDISGCARNQPVHKSEAPTPVKAPASPPIPSPPAKLNPAGRRLPAEPHMLEGSGVTVWAKGFQGLFIAGMDGAIYDNYRHAAVERAQKALQERGLYQGPINGIVDRPTMQSIYAFQVANNLQRCGVPTPHTRKMLEQGSHTDLGY